MPKSISKNDIKRVAAGALLGAAVTLALSVAMTMFMALFIASGRVGEGAGKAVVIVSAFIASVLGALTARIKNKGAALLSGAMSALFVILVRLLVMLLSENSTGFDGVDMAVMLSILCGGIVTGAIGAPKRRRRR